MEKDIYTINYKDFACEICKSQYPLTFKEDEIEQFFFSDILGSIKTYLTLFAYEINSEDISKIIIVKIGEKNKEIKIGR